MPPADPMPAMALPVQTGKTGAKGWLGSLPLVSAFLALTALTHAPAQAHMHGMYATKAEAEKRAAQLKCSGTFAMGNQWMPCANERALHNALQRAQ